MQLPDYSREDLLNWLFENNIEELHGQWVARDYDIKLTPSVDRLDDYKPYSFANIRLVTWDENHTRGHEDKRNGINNKNSRAVNQLTMSGGFVEWFHSMNQATRDTGVRPGHISECCMSLRKQAGGFLWEYAEEIRKWNNDVLDERKVSV